MCVKPGQPALLQVQPPPGNLAILLGTPGRPCEGTKFELPGLLVPGIPVDPFAAFDLTYLGSNALIPPQQQGKEFTFTAVNVELGTFQLFAGNTVTYKAL